jgi:GxxExxY protein
MKTSSPLTKKTVNALVYRIVGAAIEVHRSLGPGLLESVYEQALEQELKLQGIQVERQKKVTVEYKGLVLETELRYDLLVEQLVMVEVKSQPQMPPVFEAQLLTYMRYASAPKGLLLNFMVHNLYKEGTRSLVNDLYAALPVE